MKNSEIRKTRDDDRLNQMKSQMRGHEEELQESHMSLQEYQEQLEHLQSMIELKSLETQDTIKKYDTAANFLVQCMEDVKKKIVSVASDDRDLQNRSRIMILPGKQRNYHDGWICSKIQFKNSHQCPSEEDVLVGQISISDFKA